jgi:ribosome recycling factor
LLAESRDFAFRAMHQFKVLKTMAQTTFDLDDVKRRMQGALQSFKGDLASLRSGRASANMLDPIQVEAYGARQPLAQLATVSVPEARLLSVQVWDRSMVGPVEKAIRESDLGLNPQTEGQVLRIRIPELNEQRRKEMVKVAHKYAEESKIAVRHVRRDAIDIIKKVEKDGAFTKDDVTRQSDLVQKATDQHISEIDQALATKEKEILSV